MINELELIMYCAIGWDCLTGALPELHLASTSVLLDHEHKGQQLVCGYNEAHNRLERGAYEASEAPHDRRSCLWPKPSTAA
jgi:hypothetical protein